MYFPVDQIEKCEAKLMDTMTHWPVTLAYVLFSSMSCKLQTDQAPCL